jgi:hypothetical protein
MKDLEQPCKIQSEQQAIWLIFETGIENTSLKGHSLLVIFLGKE